MNIERISNDDLVLYLKNNYYDFYNKEFLALSSELQASFLSKCDGAIGNLILSISEKNDNKNLDLLKNFIDLIVKKSRYVDYYKFSKKLPTNRTELQQFFILFYKLFSEIACYKKDSQFSNFHILDDKIELVDITNKITSKKAIQLCNMSEQMINDLSTNANINITLSTFLQKIK